MITSLMTRFAACDPGGILPTWYKFLKETTVAGKCTPDFTFPDDVGRILLAIFEILLRIGGIAAVVFIIYGGFQYLTSQGEPDKAKAARTTIINSLVGMVIAIMATVIVNLVAGNIT